MHPNVGNKHFWVFKKSSIPVFRTRNNLSEFVTHTNSKAYFVPKNTF